ncbi:MAG: flippase-like domain-containing protein [Clostridiales bacterium]|nr:flippase-like domain-containing protein [Clostridiales bacterium]
MVKKTLLFNKLKRFKKGSLLKGQFFSDQHLLENQISIEELTAKETQELQKKDMEDKLGEANQEAAKQKSKKKKITNAITFALNIVIVVVILVVQLSTSEVESFSDIIASGFFKWQFIPLILVFFAVIMFLETIRSSIYLHNACNKYRMGLCFRMIAIGRYWDGVTPLSTGGEPMQIFYLNKHGVDAGTSISIPLARYVIYQISWLMVSIFAIIYSINVYGETNLVSIASYIGFGINALVLIGTWVLSVSKKLGKILVAKSLKFLQKIKLIKNYEKVYDKVMDTVNGYQTTMTKYTKNIKQFILMIFLQVLQFVVCYTITYFIYLMLGGAPGWDIWLSIVVYSILIDLAASFIPIPGGTGMSEVSFTIIFGSIFPNGTVFWGMLLSRFMNHYIYLIQGLFVTVYDYVWGNKKYEWQKKKWELEAESNKFKQSQIKKYNKRARVGKIKL